MKKFLIFCLLILLTGCSVDYDLTITNKEKINEKMTIYVNNDEILSSYSSVDEYLDYYSNLYKTNQGYEDYKITTKKGKVNSYFKVENNYKNLDEYVSSLSFKSMFTSADIERIGKYVSFTTSKNAYLESVKNGNVVSEEDQYEDFKISIKFYNEVTASNAEEVDEKNNIYTWIVSEDSETDYIYFKIGPKVKYNILISDYILNNLATIVIISSSTLIIGGIILFVYIKSKKNNEV